jgi:hypothetical protein
LPAVPEDVVFAETEPVEELDFELAVIARY